MTAEIAIMNKTAIALASDSAVTIGNRDKFYNTANKLFMLSKFHPVGIMIYNNAEFMGVPWEIIIKQYRTYIRDKELDFLEDYFYDFIEFLNSNEILNLKDYEKEYFATNVISFLKEVDNEIRQNYKEFVEKYQRKPNKNEINLIIKNVIDNYYNLFNSKAKLKNLPSNYEKYINNEYKNIVLRLIDEILLDHKEMDSIILDNLIQCCYNIFIKEVEGPLYSGLVIAGYGEKNIFPALISGHFYGILNGHVKYILKQRNEINRDNDNCIIPFAQTEIVDTFLTGINPNYLNVLDGAFESEILSVIKNISNKKLDKSEKDKLIKELNIRWDNIMNNILNFSNNKYVYPILQAVSVAPKDELAKMAESLVNLTSFKRQVSIDEYSRTVGGPIDVAVISKGDGFVWIKRKHYFKPELNHHFFNNYYNDCKEDYCNENNGWKQILSKILGGRL